MVFASWYAGLASGSKVMFFLPQDVKDGANMPQFAAAMWALARACYKVEHAHSS